MAMSVLFLGEEYIGYDDGGNDAHEIAEESYPGGIPGVLMPTLPK